MTGSLLVGSALRGVTFLEVKGRHQPLPQPLTQRTSPSPFLLSSHAWNHQNLDLKPPVFFSTTQNAKMQGGHNRFPTSDALNSKCLVDAPVGLIAVKSKGSATPTPTFEMMGLSSLKVEISSKFWAIFLFFLKIAEDLLSQRWPTTWCLKYGSVTG